MGDGGFWHNGLLSGVASNLHEQGRRRAGDHEERLRLGHRHAGAALLAAEEARTIAVGKSAAHADRTIEDTLTGLGVKWLRTVNNYDVGEMAKTYQRGDDHRSRRASRSSSPRASASSSGSAG